MRDEQPLLDLLISRDSVRVRRYVISGEQLLRLVIHRKTSYDCIELVELDLPEGFTIVSASVLTCPVALVLYISHPLFDPVAPGETPPTFSQKYQTVMLNKDGKREYGCDSYTIVDRKDVE